MLMTLRDGFETYIERCLFKTEDDFNADGTVVGWLGPDDKPTAFVEDRFNTEIISRRPNGVLDVWGPLSEAGFEHLSLEDALLLGFSTSEYQAGLRHRLLRGLLLQNEEQLAKEMLPPGDEWEATRREGIGDWNEWNPVRRVPYPLEPTFERNEVVGWRTENALYEDGAPADRFQRTMIFRDRITGQLSQSEMKLEECGLESLSINDALVLGFSTSEYQTALRVRILERRHISGDDDLTSSTMPPLVVRQGLERHGRDCSYRFGKGLLWARENWEKERALREWVSRVERPKCMKPFNQPSQASRTPSFWR
ncbi:hypothetical protein J5277_13515 [Rhizobium sp. 16-449-1b]|uniref:hypothetical protein n=1 Tax=Rhizobium sp. 16-449-1b TaxID=2819989 RepID=UPI001ADCCB14|nr:hypothetical protein [Rhizobium sp. 16-449-1b]MBO9195123.1 hypothetical protein [Rhizobium sp. 16-449-1b]